MSLYMGIDPGVNGGFAIASESDVIVHKNSEPETFIDWLCNPELKVICLEQVHGGVFGKGKEGQRMGATSAFTFGQGFGQLEGSIRSLQQVGLCKARLERVTPYSWQKALGLHAKGDKRVLKTKAAELFPGIRVTGWNQDALLIAHFARRF